MSWWAHAEAMADSATFMVVVAAVEPSYSPH